MVPIAAASLGQVSYYHCWDAAWLSDDIVQGDCADQNVDNWRLMSSSRLPKHDCTLSWMPAQHVKAV